MSDTKCMHNGCTARSVGSRVFCLEHCIANLEERLSAVEIEHFTDLPSPPEPWKPRTKQELADYWNAHHETTGAPLQWAVRQRTDDIARMLEEEAERATKVEHVYYAYPALCKMARRIRSLE